MWGHGLKIWQGTELELSWTSDLISLSLLSMFLLLCKLGGEKTQNNLRQRNVKRTE